MTDDWGDYESGPFCRHWGAYGDCDIVCTTCRHPCEHHGISSEIGCEDCECPTWKEE